jgi:hypothetical protein
MKQQIDMDLRIYISGALPCRDFLAEEKGKSPMAKTLLSSQGECVTKNFYNHKPRGPE